MKRKFIYFYVFILFSCFTALSLDQTTDKENNIKETVENKADVISAVDKKVDFSGLLDQVKANYQNEEYLRVLALLNEARGVVKARINNYEYETVADVNQLINNKNENQGKRIQLPVQFIEHKENQIITVLHMDSFNMIDCWYESDTDYSRMIQTIQSRHYYLVMGKVDYQEDKMIIHLEKIKKHTFFLLDR